jgi:hypothetical protein
METNYYAFTHSGLMLSLGKHEKKQSAEEEAVRVVNDPDNKWASGYAFIVSKKEILAWNELVKSDG